MFSQYNSDLLPLDGMERGRHVAGTWPERGWGIAGLVMGQEVKPTMEQQQNNIGTAREQQRDVAGTWTERGRNVARTWPGHRRPRRGPGVKPQRNNN